MPSGNVYPSGHLVPSLFWRLACATIVEISFSNLPCFFLLFISNILRYFLDFALYQRIVWKVSHSVKTVTKLNLFFLYRVIIGPIVGVLVIVLVVVLIICRRRRRKFITIYSMVIRYLKSSYLTCSSVEVEILWCLQNP